MMNKILYNLFLWIFLFNFVHASEYRNTTITEWETPRYVLVSQTNSITSKIAKSGSNLYLLSSNEGVIRIFRSTDQGKTYDSGYILDSNIQNDTDFEMVVDSEGYVHIAYLEKDTQMIRYRNFNHLNDKKQLDLKKQLRITKAYSCKRPTKHPALSACVVNYPKTIYYLYTYCKDSIYDFDLYIHKVTDPHGGFPLENKGITVTNNSYQINELSPKIRVHSSNAFVAYLDPDSHNIYLMKGLNNGTYWNESNKIQVNRNDQYCEFDFDFISDPYGTLYIAYTDKQNDGDLIIARSKDLGASFDYTKPSDDNKGLQASPVLHYYNGILYLGWFDKRDGNNNIYLTISSDNGESYEKNYCVNSKKKNQLIKDMYVDDYGVFVSVRDYDYNPAATSVYFTRIMDKPAIVISQSDNKTEVSESNSSDNLSMVLTRRPSSEVGVELITEDQIKVLPSRIFFTPDDWEKERIISISAIDDDIYENDHSDIISFVISSTDPAYANMNVKPVTVTIHDNESQPVIQFANHSSHDLENKTNVSIEVMTNQIAAHNIKTSFVVNGGSASPDEDFQIINEQVVIQAGQRSSEIIISIFNDNIDEDDESIELSLESDCQACIKTHIYTIEDDDNAKIIFNESNTTTEVSENGLTDSYTIVLGSQTIDSVSISPQFDHHAIVILPEIIEFTDQTWNIPVIVNVEAIDNKCYEGSFYTQTITYKVTSNDEKYQFPNHDINVFIQDNDSPVKAPKVWGKTPTNKKSPTWFWAGDGTGFFRYSRVLEKLANASTISYTKTLDFQNLPDGEHTLYVQEQDGCESWSKVGEHTILIDTKKPISTATSPIRVDSQSRHFTITYLVDNSSDESVIPVSDLSKVSLFVSINNYDNYLLIDEDIDKAIDGIFEYKALKEGKYYFKTIAADKAGNEEMKSNRYDTSTLYQENFSGYAIISIGSKKGNEGIDTHLFTASRVYENLTRNGFQDNQILYYVPKSVQKIPKGADNSFENHEKALQNAIEIWAYDRINELNAPLYIVLIGHGSLDLTEYGLSGAFHLNTFDRILPYELNEWINTLETNLSSIKNIEPIIITIIGSCFSGMFQNELFESNKNRIVITSTDENEESFRGGFQPGGARDGEFFITQLFNSFANGINLHDSFDYASKLTKQYSNYAQNPIMSEMSLEALNVQIDKSVDSLDHVKITDAGVKPSEIILSRTMTVDAEIKNITMWAKINTHNLTRIENVYVEIIKPNSLPLNTDSNPEIASQKQWDQETVELEWNSENNCFESIVQLFNPGKYSIFFNVKDQNQIVRTSEQHVLFSKTSNSNLPPDPFSIIHPQNQDTSQNTSLFLMWEHAKDPENDKVSYNVLLHLTDIPKENKIITNINKCMLYIEIPEWDGKWLTWKVVAVDEYGNSTDSMSWSFIPDNKNTESHVVNLNLFNTYRKTNIVTDFNQIQIIENNSNIVPELTNGIMLVTFYYSKNIFVLNPIFNINIDNYQPVSISQDIRHGFTCSIDVALTPCVTHGNINGDTTIDLNDAILYLQLLAEFKKDITNSDSTISANRKIGIKEAIYVMQQVTKQ